MTIGIEHANDNHLFDSRFDSNGNFRFAGPCIFLWDYIFIFISPNSSNRRKSNNKRNKIKYKRNLTKQPVRRFYRRDALPVIRTDSVKAEEKLSEKLLNDKLQR